MCRTELLPRASAALLVARDGFISVQLYVGQALARHLRLLPRNVLRCLMLLALITNGELHAADLTFFAEERPPTNYMSGRAVVGSATDTIRVMLARTRLDGRFEVVPWQRAIALAESQEDTCAFATKRNEERETHFRWLEPISSAQAVLYARAGSPIQLRTLAEAKRYRIGGYLGDAFAAGLREAGYTVELVDRNALNGKKLVLGRIDLWIGNEAKPTIGAFATLIPTLILPRVDLYVACNRNLSPSVVSRLARALHDMREDGAYEAIQARYRRASRPLPHPP